MVAKVPFKTVKVDQLHFDYENPRLAEYGLSKKSNETEILRVLWETMDVAELVQSIAASGYFEHEPLIVVEDDDRFIVIEGNRRLAAVKVLLNNELVKKHGWQVPQISESAVEALKKLPVIVSTRQDSWRYLGFKHVNGPAKWSSYAKASYIAEVHRDYKVSLADIATQIGDRHRTVQRLYRGLMVIDQAESAKVFNRNDRFRPRFAFSHLYTGLDYEGISTFLDLKSEDEETTQPVPKAKLSNLGELCFWLFGSKAKKAPPLVESQNPHLRQLDAVLKNREGIAALRDGSDLANALELTRPSEALFEESLLRAKRELLRARSHLTTGYDGSEALLRIAGSVANIADDVYSEMDRKRSPGKKPRMSEND